MSVPHHLPIKVPTRAIPKQLPKKILNFKANPFVMAEAKQLTKMALFMRDSGVTARDGATAFTKMLTAHRLTQDSGEKI